MSDPITVWRREPYRLLFPLGWLLALFGTGPWVLFATGLDPTYRNVFHAMAQVQGFLTCYALGFLLTFIPRRTATAPPPAALIVVSMICPALTIAFAFAGQWAASQVSWVVVLMAMATFAIRRARQAGARAVPPGFAWVPLTLAVSVAGTVVTGVAAAVGPHWMWLHDVARGVVLQGTFSGLVLGVGSFLLPILVYGTPPPELAVGARRVRALLHLVAAAAFFGSFAIEAGVGVTAGYALRAAVALAVLVTAGLHRWPSATGTHRKLAWLGVWCLPLGFAIVAALPAYRYLGLHVVFIGGFAMTTFAVSTHVALAHGGGDPGRASIAARLMLILLGTALLSRGLAVVDLMHFRLWLGAAGGAFLLAAFAWLRLVVGYIVVRR
jgi:uncharacterized protein involved in response to NO